MAQQRLIDGAELYGIESLLDTDVIQSSKEASWLLSQVLYDIKAMPTIDPEDLPIVRSLRRELRQLTHDAGQDIWAVERRRREHADAEIVRLNAKIKKLNAEIVKLQTVRHVSALTPAQLYNLGKLAARAKYNADHIRDKATEDERRNIKEKADALAAALRLATEVSEK